MPDNDLLHCLRSTDQRWRIGMLNGPNMPNLGHRDRVVYGDLESMAALVNRISQLCDGLGVDLAADFCSNSEGEILTWIHAEVPGLDGIIVNPAGSTLFGESIRHALSETLVPFIEVHFANIARRNIDSRFTSTAVGICHGMRRHSYSAAIIGMVGMLDAHDLPSDAFR